MATLALLCFFSAIGEIIAEDGTSCFPAWHRKASQGSGNSSLIYLGLFPFCAAATSVLL